MLSVVWTSHRLYGVVLPRPGDAMSFAFYFRSGSSAFDAYSDDSGVVKVEYNDNYTVTVTAVRVGEAVVKVWMPASGLAFAATDK